MSKAILVAGLAYGDEGKGATVDFLCRQLPVDLVVRYNGGSQAAHNVVAPNGVHHTFAQFGSGMMANVRVRTHLSRHMLVDPLSMMNEAEALTQKLEDEFRAGPNWVWDHTTVDPRCVIITPFHQRVNRLREEARGDARHGSCGMGVGVARELSLKYGDEVLLASDLQQSGDFLMHMLMNTAEKMNGELKLSYQAMRDWCRQLTRQYQTWPVTLREDAKVLAGSELAVFEGAQGVLLDETHGVAPHNTWTDCTFGNADKLLDEAGMSDRFRVGCLRTYFTRHGAGTLKDEEAVDSAGYRWLARLEPHNAKNEWQGAFRAAPFDFDLAKHAVEIVGGVDCVALSHLDRFEVATGPLIDLINREIASVGIVAAGPAATHREFTTVWADAQQKETLA